MPTKIEISIIEPRTAVRKAILENGEVWELTGECNRCGQCCEQTKMPVPELRNPDGSCKKYTRETENGIQQGKCNIMWSRPYWCAIYPRDPHEKLHDKCSYIWKRIK